MSNPRRPDRGDPFSERRRRPPVRRGSDLDPHLSGALAYLLGPVTGILFLVLDRHHPFVRFHAVQCLIVSVVWVAAWMAIVILGVLLGWVPLLGWLVEALLAAVVTMAGLVLWIYLMVRAFNGDEWEVPVLGHYARNFASRAE